MMVAGVRWGDGRRPALGTGRLRTALAILLAVLCAWTLSASSAPQVEPAASGGTGRLVDVIVQASDRAPGSVDLARRTVTDLHGDIGRDLPIINGFTARVPATALGSLRASAGVASATLDGSVTLAGSTYNPGTDAGSPVGVTQITGATAYWAAGYIGTGVGVALIDSGVAPVDGLRASGKVFYGPDYTPGGAPSLVRSMDLFGHGTFMAGLIAGRSDDATRPYAAGNATFLGMAPDAHVVSVKVADGNGITEDSAVIAGIQWVVQHKDDPGLNIRVLNLALGSHSDVPYTQDPIAAAAEQAWKAGIVVIASAGNDGAAGLASPAYDPYLLAVGAIDTHGTLSISDDSVASFSNTGTNTGSGTRNPDLATVGTHVVGLRVPGSYVDRNYGSGAGSVSSGLMRGSGTSEAAAITSGAVALLLSQRPGLTPDQVKTLLTGHAQALPGLTPATAGAGALNLGSVFGAATASASAARQSFTSAASGAVPPDSSNPASTMPWGSPWFGWAYTDYSAPVSYSDPVWTSSRWTGGTWTSSRWTTSRWTTSRWTTSRWSDANWATENWD